MEMEPDTENMAMNEYWEYEAAKERQLMGADNPKRIGQGIVQDSICEQDVDLEEDEEENGDDGDIFYIDEILNVTMVDEGAECSPTKDLEELKRFLAKDPQSHYTEIQGSNNKGMEFEVRHMCGARMLFKLQESIQTGLLGCYTGDDEL
nr:hypothetical protein [Tanacetum cinerariifolium]